MDKTSEFSEFDRQMMLQALTEAQKAAELGDVPVGTVLCLGQEILARAHNQRELLQDATAHAEVLAIREASAKLQTWHLEGAVLYVSLEPCLMCAGAILNSRLARVVYGASQPKTGALESKLKAFELNWNHRPIVEGGLCAEESAQLLQDFFRKKRLQRAQCEGPAARRKAALKRWQKRLEDKVEN